MSRIASAGIGDELHLAYLNDHGDLFHRMRLGNGQWTAWGQIRGAHLVSVTCSAVGAELHVTAVNQEEISFHTIRYPNGHWQDIIQLPDQPLLND